MAGALVYSPLASADSSSNDTEMLLHGCGMLTQAAAVWQLTADFAREYEEKTGQAVKFRLSFGGSGTQARAVVDGLPGDMGKARHCHSDAFCLYCLFNLSF